MATRARRRGGRILCRWPAPLRLSADPRDQDVIGALSEATYGNSARQRSTAETLGRRRRRMGQLVRLDGAQLRAADGLAQDAAPWRAGSRVLDVACGAGY